MNHKTYGVLLLLGVVVAAVVVSLNQHESEIPTGVLADHLVIEKSKRRLTLYSGNMVIKSYMISLGKEPVGKKTREGDKRTPEGSYIIDSRIKESAFHRALHISYPNKSDIAVANKAGVSPGGAIMIHGIRNGLGWVGTLHRLVDWTAGCIAVTDWEIEELWRVVPDGTSIQIQP